GGGARPGAGFGTIGTPPNVDGLSINDALDIFAESAEDVPALLAEVERLRRGRDIWRAERDRLAATVDRVRALHRPVEIEPSETICGHCSSRLPNGRCFGKGDRKSTR